MRGPALALLTAGFLGSISSAETIYVDADARGGNNGQSWEDAYTDLQDALGRAQHDDQIWVAEGEYLPTATLDREATFATPNGVMIYGGFSGVERSVEERDWRKNITVLSGNIGKSEVDEDNSYHVVESIGSDASTRLDGFRITAAHNERLEGLGRGGGMYIESSRMTVANCRFEDNFARGGGGIWTLYSYATFTNCELVHNRNRAVTNWTSHSKFFNCLFEENACWGQGAGVADVEGSASSFYNCRFIRNHAGRRGGGFYAKSYNNSVYVFENCTFIGNITDEWHGGGGYLWNGRARMTNCTFFRNRATISSGGFFGDRDYTNCIFWGNEAGGPTEKNQIGKSDDFSMNYCCVEGWTGEYGGEGNMGDDPLLALADDAHVMRGSPAIDTGTNDPPGGLPAQDLDGNPRPLDGDKVA